jgi:hypothetical protein
MDFISVEREGKGRFQSRDILYFCGVINKETIHFYVNHWPSRYGGYNKTKTKRNLASEILRGEISKITGAEKEAKIILMGDFNATSDEDCLSEILHAGAYKENRDAEKLVNLSDILEDGGGGTIRYKGKWELFDHFIVSNSLLSGTGLTVDVGDTYICSEKFLMEADNRYLGFKPYRTYLGPSYHGGISDHLPIVTVLKSGQ